MDGEPLILLVHVDDALIFGPNKELIEKFKAHLRQEYVIVDMGPAKYCLGWEIRKMRNNQCQYIKEVLKRFNMQDCVPKLTPMASNVTLSREMEPETAEEKAEMNMYRIWKHWEVGYVYET